MSLDNSHQTLFPETVIGKSRDGFEVSLVTLNAKDATRLSVILASINPWADYGVPSVKLERYLSFVEPGAPRLGIVVAGRVVGVAGFMTNWLRGPYLQFLGIEPEFQGRGLGGLLLSWFELEARKKSCANLWVMVSHMEGSARSFYEAHGFVKECEISDLVVAGRDEILMRKRLNPDSSS